MNVSAALGVPVYVLFSTVTPYTFSSALRPIVPKGGVEPQLGARKLLSKMPSPRCGETVFCNRNYSTIY